ncbi:hypothetical protein D3C86_1776050 [compost metagenome]
MGTALDREFSIVRNPVRPSESFGAFEQLIESCCFELPHKHEDAICRTQPKIGATDGQFVTKETDASILNGHLLIAEVTDFTGNDSFKSHRARGD